MIAALTLCATTKQLALYGICKKFYIGQGCVVHVPLPLASLVVMVQLERQKYKSYSQTKLTNAYLDVTDNKLSVAKATRKYCLSEQTLRDRVLGHISLDNVTSGPPPVFDCEQEARLVQHIKEMGAVGYAYTRAEVVGLGSECAVHLGMKTKDDKQL
ncbi:unnamed protein product [Mytilus coruscus]|uniref:HTH psq-type domain-containing protein n=1 Tax=Mytilus coruscus TaxID=42192 RepID=A0A6J8AKV1_MYTCO|nr:unnamed protein product [Mytilus coruscus]